MMTEWAKTHHVRDEPLCLGAGGHIHTHDGQPLYRHFLCLVFMSSASGLSPKTIWLHAVVPPVVTSIRPPDLNENPLAPVPPAGYERQYLTARGAYERLIAAPWASGRSIAEGSCRGEGFHYHLPQVTVFRSFRCSVIAKTKPTPPPKRGSKAPPSLSLGKVTTIWLQFAPDGSMRITHSKPSDLWP